MVQDRGRRRKSVSGFSRSQWISACRSSARVRGVSRVTHPGTYTCANTDPMVLIRAARERQVKIQERIQKVSRL
jgi:hypothetical protein